MKSRTIHRTLIWVAMFFSVAHPASLEAARASSGDERRVELADLKRLSLEDLMNIEVETVTSASKYEQRVTEAPSSVTIITSDDIRKYGYRTLADVLRGVRGFYITYDRNYAFIGARGFGRPGDYNTRILLMVDGHTINDTIYDTAAVGTEFILDTDLIDRIEISRGPGSSLYGSNAFFGVIDIKTRKGRDLGGTEVAVEAASAGTYGGRASYGGVLNNGADLLISASGFRSHGRDLYFPEFDPANPAHDPRAVNNGVAEDADTDENQRAFARYSSGGVTLTAGQVRRRKGIPTASFETVFNTTSTFTVDEHAYSELRYDHGLDRGGAFSARVSYDEYRYAGDYLSDISSSGTPTIVVIRDDVAGRWWEGELQWTSSVAGLGKITLGTFLKDNISQNQNNFDVSPFTSHLADRRNSFVWALYGQDETEVLKDLTLNAGLRYDHYETFGGTINPRLGLIYRSGPDRAMKVLYGRAFRSPNIYELYYNDGIYSKANPYLRPETIDTYEAVYERYFGNEFRTSISYYHYAIKDLITLIEDTDTKWVYRNISVVDANGVEFEIEGKTQTGFRGLLSAAYQRAEDREANTVLTNSPRLTSKLNVSVPIVRDRVFCGIEEQYMGDRKTLKGPAAEDFIITNLTLSSVNVLPRMDASLSVNNLFDRRYGDPASEEHAQIIIPQDGRTVRVKLTYAF